ncbi:MAG: hypothetical protein M1826_000388 [Phylliscum demangeonii]|nr:MAG: hypothetical protein M1826_000388 [Phylliscum demangeonii]
MPLPIIAEVIFHGLSAVPFARPALKTVPWLLLIYLLKRYFGGATNRSERLMHSKVVMMTGGTSGIGAVIARQLAQRGAQIVLLSQHPAADAFLVEYVEDLRAQTGNALIYAEHVDLSSLHSIRLFATRWIDNAPPRRLDLVILCANVLQPPFAGKALATACTRDGLEPNWGINYLANFHLLSLLSPALRAQPADREVRVILGTCSSYIGAEVLSDDPGAAVDDDARPAPPPRRSGGSTALYGASKLALMIFGHSLQKHLDAYTRPDKQANNARVIVVDPGWSRTPGMRRYLSAGSLWGLLCYLLTWPLWWLVLKSAEQGAQPFLFAAMDAGLGAGPGAKLIKEGRVVDYARPEVRDDAVAKRLWHVSEKRIEALEKEGAMRRAREKKAVDPAVVERGADGNENSTAAAGPSTRMPSVRGRKTAKEKKTVPSAD